MLKNVAPLIALTITLGACGGDDTSSNREALTVMAASSLTEVLTEMAARFEDAHPRTEVRLNFAASSELAVQIGEGAPADVFASADVAQMAVVDAKGLVGESAGVATNRLVILIPSDDPADIDEVQDLAREGTKLVLAGPEVPAGHYALQALSRLGLKQAVETNVVSEEQDVKEVVTKIVLGEADAGIVYATDVTNTIADDVRAIELPPEGQVEVVYLLATLTDAPNPGGAKLFFDFVLSDRGLAILESYGFGPP